MKRLPPLPGVVELGLFALVAVTCAGAATLARAHDLAMAGFATPIFIFAAWMGMRRSGQWSAMAPAPAELEQPAEIDPAGNVLEDEEPAV